MDTWRLAKIVIWVAALGAGTAFAFLNADLALTMGAFYAVGAAALALRTLQPKLAKGFRDGVNVAVSAAFFTSVISQAHWFGVGPPWRLAITAGIVLLAIGLLPSSMKPKPAEG